MYRKPEIESAENILRDIFSPQLWSEDLQRLQSGHYGVRAKTLGGEHTVVLAGLRSGLEACLHLEGNGSIRLVVIDIDANVEKIVKRLQYVFGQRVQFFRSFSEFLRGISVEFGLFIRVDRSYFRDYLENFQELLQFTSSVCGEAFSSMKDPLEIYRELRYAGIDFHWSVLDLNLRLSSASPPAKYEVSVVVPAFKISLWIDRCLQTLAHQTLQRLEVVVVDDGSPDDSGVKADAWAEKFPGRIKVLHTPNGGCAAARKNGLDVAEGEFIGFVDGDDWVDLHMFEDLYRAAVLKHADIAQCGYTLAYESDGRLEPVMEYFPSLISNPRDSLTTRPTIWRRIYRKSFLRSNKITFPTHIRRFDDLPFQFLALAAARSVATIPENYYYYRQERPGQDIGIRDDRLNVHFEIFDWIDQQIRQFIPRNTEQQLIKVEINTHAWALSIIDPTHHDQYLRKAAAQLFRERRHHTIRHIIQLGLEMPKSTKKQVNKMIFSKLMGLELKP